MTARLLALTLAVAALIWPASPPLAIVNTVVHDLEDGPAIPPGFSFVSGQFIFLSFQVAGYSATPERKLRLTCVAAKFLTQANRRRILQMGSADFDDRIKFLRFYRQRLLQLAQRGNQ